MCFIEVFSFLDARELLRVQGISKRIYSKYAAVLLKFVPFKTSEAAYL